MKHIKDILNASQKEEALQSTGFDAVDKLIGGYKPGELIVLAGHAVSGRKMLMYSIARKLVFEKGVVVGLFDVAEDATSIVHNILGEEEAHLAMLDSVPLYINEKLRIRADELCQQILELNQSHDCRCFFIEGFSFIDFSTEDKNTIDKQISNLAKELKRLVAELNITIFVGASLNWMSWEREGYEGFPPRLSDLAGEGDFDESADIIIGVFRPEARQIYFDEKGRDLRGIIKLEVLKGERLDFNTIEFFNHNNSILSEKK